MRSAGTPPPQCCWLPAIRFFGSGTHGPGNNEGRRRDQREVPGNVDWQLGQDQRSVQPGADDVSTWTISTTCSKFHDMQRHDEERPGLDRAYRTMIDGNIVVRQA